MVDLGGRVRRFGLGRRWRGGAEMRLWIVVLVVRCERGSQRLLGPSPPRRLL